MKNVVAFCIIIVIVILLIIAIALREWYLIQPYVQLAATIAKIVLIVKSFTQDIILAIANYIKLAKKDLFALFKFGNLDLVVMNNLVSCGSHLDQCIAEKTKEMGALGKKIIIGAFGKGAYPALKLANSLESSGKDVYLMLIEPTFQAGEEAVASQGVHVINILPEGEKAIVEGIDMVVNNPVTRSLEDYIKSIEQGVLASV